MALPIAINLFQYITPGTDQASSFSEAHCSLSHLKVFCVSVPLSSPSQLPRSLKYGEMITNCLRYLEYLNYVFLQIPLTILLGEVCDHRYHRFRHFVTSTMLSYLSLIARRADQHTNTLGKTHTLE